jgi:hypothetical protein
VLRFRLSKFGALNFIVCKFGALRGCLYESRSILVEENIRSST